MNYIVLDLEWNQSSTRKEGESADLLFEIVEIGAVKLDDRCVMTGEFSRLIKPEVYHEMHLVTSRLIHLQMQELERGRPFAEVAEEFLSWCGAEEFLFCTWGSLDLTEFQKNMDYYHMTPLSEGPLAFLDVQKLFSIAYEDGKLRRALEYAVDALQIEKDIPFHRAFSDAYYTARILKTIAEEKPEVLKKVSYDIYRPPVSRRQEIRVRFDNYEKYISRVFADKAEAFGDKEVSSSKCYVCHRNLKKKLRWFTPNGKNYYCLACCEKHGYLKGKIRIRRTGEGKLYVVKTTKLITGEEAAELIRRRDRAAEVRRRHASHGGPGRS